jgi:hypothetical protein
VPVLEAPHVVRHLPPAYPPHPPHTPAHTRTHAAHTRTRIAAVTDSANTLQSRPRGRGGCAYKLQHTYSASTARLQRVYSASTAHLQRVYSASTVFVGADDDRRGASTASCARTHPTPTPAHSPHVPARPCTSPARASPQPPTRQSAHPQPRGRGWREANRAVTRALRALRHGCAVTRATAP